VTVFKVEGSGHQFVVCWLVKLEDPSVVVDCK
jgi:hypothetical protein